MVKIAVVFACFLIVSVWASGAPTCTTADTTRWLADSLKEMETIQAGMTRQDLLKVFRPAGGFSSSSRFKAIFVYRDSPFVRVEVEFARPEGASRDNAAESPQDVVTSISRPCLAQPAYD